MTNPGVFSIVIVASLAALGAASSADTVPAAVVSTLEAARGIQTGPSLSDAEIERFLSQARIVSTRKAGSGVTDSVRATLSDGTLVHDAQIQTVDETKREFRTKAGVEFDFRDSWSFNVAAYRLDRLLMLGLVPVSVERSVRSVPAAVTWWVDDVMMDERARAKGDVQPPEELSRYWHQQVAMLRVFDQLIDNTDRNPGNVLITRGWRLWAIDHTRAFRKNRELRIAAYVIRCDRVVFERLKALTLESLKKALRPHLEDPQLTAILARRDAIVAKLERLGETAIFDRVVPADVK
jgi:hypothetical protein